jgi:O-methyltransferase
MKTFMNNFLAKYLKFRLIRIKPRKPIQIVEASEWDIETLEICSRISMQSDERIWALINATKYIVQRNVPGVFVECGVWKGASAVAISRTLVSLGVTDRDIYLFDTFEGMTEPSGLDKRISDSVPASQLLEATEIGDGDNVWAKATEESVREILNQQEYPAARFKIIKGDVIKTLHNIPSFEISLLRLDTDWYESTKIELEILFPRLVISGILIVDDFGHWDGSRRAVSEFFAGLDTKYLLSMVDYTGRLLIKN